MVNSSVDNESFTGDQARSVAKEEHGGIADIFDHAFASERNQRFGEPCSSEAAHAFGSGDGSWDNHVRSNAPGTLLDGDHT